jgi:hypothetical protein
MGVCQDRHSPDGSECTGLLAVLPAFLTPSVIARHDSAEAIPNIQDDSIQQAVV